MRHAWRWCAAAGIVAFICSWAFGRIPGLIACGPTTGGLGPIIAFEFARTPADVAALFGLQPCTSILVGAQKTGLLLDSFGFIPSYTAFLILGAIAAGSSGRIRTALVATFIVAGVSDQIEGVILYAILRDLPGTPALLGSLWWAVYVKFALLALGTIGIGSVLGRDSWPRRIAGIPIFLGGFFAFAGLIRLIRSPGTADSWMMPGFTTAWVALLIVALISSFAPSVFAPARAAPPPDPAAPSA